MRWWCQEYTRTEIRIAIQTLNFYSVQIKSNQFRFFSFLPAFLAAVVLNPPLIWTLCVCLRNQREYHVSRRWFNEWLYYAEKKMKLRTTMKSKTAKIRMCVAVIVVIVIIVLLPSSIWSNSMWHAVEAHDTHGNSFTAPPKEK